MGRSSLAALGLPFVLTPTISWGLCNFLILEKENVMDR